MHWLFQITRIAKQIFQVVLQSRFNEKYPRTMSGRSEDIFDSANFDTTHQQLWHKKVWELHRKIQIKSSTNLSIVANFRWIIWIDWPFARRTVRYVYLLQGIWIIWISRPFAKKTVNYCNLLQMTWISGPASLLLKGQVATALCCKWSGLSGCAGNTKISRKLNQVTKIYAIWQYSIVSTFSQFEQNQALKKTQSV